jgi:hypothetical protein
MKLKLPLHDMIVVVKVTFDLYTLSYVKYIDNDVHQCIKYNLSTDDIAQFLGNN